MRFAIRRAAMHDAMADGVDRPAGKPLFEPVEQRLQGPS